MRITMNGNVHGMAATVLPQIQHIKHSSVDIRYYSGFELTVKGSK